MIFWVILCTAKAVLGKTKHITRISSPSSTNWYISHSKLRFILRDLPSSARVYFVPKLPENWMTLLVCVWNEFHCFGKKEKKNSKNRTNGYRSSHPHTLTLKLCHSHRQLLSFYDSATHVCCVTWGFFVNLFNSLIFASTLTQLFHKLCFSSW